MNRRHILASIVATAALGACSSAPTVTVAQIVADAKGAVVTLQATEAAIILANPKAIPSALQAMLAQLGSDAMAALNGLPPLATPTATAITLQTVETYFNAALTAVGAVLAADPVLQAKYGIAFDAVQALIVGVIEPYITQVLATGTTPPTTPAFDKQRSILGITH